MEYRQGKNSDWKRNTIVGLSMMGLATIVLIGARNYFGSIGTGWAELIFWLGLLVLIMGGMKLLDGVHHFEKKKGAATTGADGVAIQTSDSADDAKNRQLGYVLIVIGSFALVVAPLVLLGFILAGGGDSSTVPTFFGYCIVFLAFILVGSYFLTKKTTSIIKSVGFALAIATAIIMAIGAVFFIASQLL